MKIRSIVCIDALELSEEQTPRDQAGKELLLRELIKCHTGFSAVRNETVATGAWGCGAFGGDKEVKFAIQLAAASQAGVKCLRFRFLSYHKKDFN